MNIANSLSLLRGVLALFLAIESPLIRVSLIIIAALTDIFDGFFARKLQQISRFGTLVDPLMDKFFVATALFWFFAEDKLTLLQLLSFFLRDVSLLLFSAWLLLTGTFHHWTIQSFISGKITTALQFACLLFLALNWSVPDLAYWTMAFFGAFSLIELMYRKFNGV